MFSYWGTERSRGDPDWASMVGAAAISSAAHAIWINVLVRYCETGLFS